MSEQCARCGDGPDDLRSLWMACFYAMEELGIGLKEIELQDTRYAEQNGTERIDWINMTVPTFEKSEGEPINRRFYTMRVCKDCRADWLQAIGDWFKAKPTDPDASGSPFYTRHLGTTISVPPDDLMREATDA